ncbi:hypothetical protein CHS0354_011014 [Potamilus streckersoni]|uniref:Uncharacterized protein n=1 Tax=Potamilus streckersoni TaxID=2493646 RepID=A0AAE0TM97_9BIVA|nr:hypothetical protein CHS0354_011014 [Potamilus streckersoni]
MVDNEVEDTILSSSPMGRLHLSEGSDVFKAVMREFNVDSRFMLENKYCLSTRKEASLAKNDDDNVSNQSSASERINIREKYENPYHHVRWVDEVLNKPLVKEFKECSDDSRERSDSLQKTEGPKPIIKSRATCFIIVSNR